MQLRNLFLISALLLGLFLEQFAVSLQGSLIYILCFMMSLSLQSISISIFKPQLKILKPIISTILLNYFLFGIILMLLVYLIIPYEKALYIGFLMIAVAPPGVVIVPFAVRMKSDINYAALGVVGAYLFTIILFPLTLFLLGVEVDFMNVFKLIFYSVVLPMFISRIFRYPAIFKFTKRHQSLLIDISFFILIYVVIGINKSVLIDDFRVSILPLLVLSILLFPIAIGLLFLLKKLQKSKEISTNFSLLLMVKNNGFSAVSSLTLFGTVASIPSAALSVVLLLYLIALPGIMDFIYKKPKQLELVEQIDLESKLELKLK